MSGYILANGTAYVVAGSSLAVCHKQRNGKVLQQNCDLGRLPAFKRLSTQAIRPAPGGEFKCRAVPATPQLCRQPGNDRNHIARALIRNDTFSHGAVCSQRCVGAFCIEGRGTLKP